MAKKTVEELEAQIALEEALVRERIVNNALYAAKLVERIVYGMIGLILIAVVGAIIALVVKGG